ncbi:MAG: CHASE2 domain-containing protein [Deltaproteobacteria bacterium]|nr:CHASE2 domain-containing protein [Deltaproteobacteria bacterium]
MKKAKLRLPDFALGLSVTLLVLMLAVAGALTTWEMKLYDMQSRVLEKPVGDNVPIAIVAVDEVSVKKIGRFPWPRSILAQLIDVLKSNKARVIGLGLVFSEYETGEGLKEVRQLKIDFDKSPLKPLTGGMEFFGLITKAEDRLNNDAKLAESIARAGNVILPVFFEQDSFNPQSLDKDSQVPDFIKKNSYAGVKGAADWGGQLLAPKKVVAIIPELTAAAAGIGHINNPVLFEVEGVTRSVYHVFKYLDVYFPSFAVKVVAKFGELKDDQVVADLGRNIKLGQLSVPLDPNRDMATFISFHDPEKSFPIYSAFDVLNKRVTPDAFSGKIVLIGPTAAGIGEKVVTPASPTMASVELVANQISNIIEARYITRPDWAALFDLVVALIFGLFISFVLPKLGAQKAAVFTGGILFVFVCSMMYIFSHQGMWFNLLTPSLVLILGYTVITSRRFLVTEKVKEKVEADSVETNKILAISFRQQGMLDLAMEKLRKCPIEAEGIKEELHQLGMDYERKRMFSKAINVYQMIIAADPKYQDLADRVQKLKTAEATQVFGLGPKTSPGEATVVAANGEVHPTLGRYEIMGELGRGAMGVVFKGRDPKINRIVAIKTIRLGDLDEEQIEEVKQRFFREAESAGRLTHPNIVTIYDVGEDYDVSYIAMEFLEGEELVNYCKPQNLLPMKQVLTIISQVCDALDYAHQHGIVHRDIKPANIMVLKNGEVKVTDFGIARITTSSRTKTGVILGTPSYMSPEQVAGKKVDGRSDLFSLGTILFEMLTGQKPFTGDSLTTLMYQIANTPHPSPRSFNPKIPAVMEKILAKALAKDFEKRYQRGQEFAAHLRQVAKRLEELESKKNADLPEA